MTLLLPTVELGACPGSSLLTVCATSGPFPVPATAPCAASTPPFDAESRYVTVPLYQQWHPWRHNMAPAKWSNPRSNTQKLAQITHNCTLLWHTIIALSLAHVRNFNNMLIYGKFEAERCSESSFSEARKPEQRSGTYFFPGIDLTKTSPSPTEFWVTIRSETY
jgi:hypothetical protein